MKDQKTELETYVENLVQQVVVPKTLLSTQI